MARSTLHQEFATLRGGPHEARWTGRVEVLEAALARPRQWPSPRSVFVNSASDLFHEQVPFEFVARAVEVMAANHEHTFGICTKRADRMVKFFEWFGPVPDNVLPGVTVERIDYTSRVEALAQIPAKTRWIAAEPLLGPLDSLKPYLGSVVNWVTFGPEIGAKRRECDPKWARQLLADCREANVPFFTKHKLDGEAIRERPWDLT